MATLEAILERARAAAGADRSATYTSLQPGDVVQLRPGADPTWETSLLLVTQALEDGRIRGQVLRPHRSGCREAWYTFSTPEVIRIGRTPFPEPPAAVRAWCYEPRCPFLQRKPPAREGSAPPTYREAQGRELEERSAILRMLAAEIARLRAGK
jgi:hypothetical protein